MTLLSLAFKLDIQDRRMLTREFDFLHRLVTHIPVRRLTVPDSFAALPAVQAAILHDLAAIMLTLPSVHPFLMPLIIEGRLDVEQLTALPHHSWTTIIEEAIAQRVAAVLFRRLNIPTTSTSSPII